MNAGGFGVSNLFQSLRQQPISRRVGVCLPLQNLIDDLAQPASSFQVVHNGFCCFLPDRLNEFCFNHPSTPYLEGSRFEVHPDKKNARDFALWKRAEPKTVLKWQSPWGTGFPGWHIECAIMGLKYLGSQFDIHGGARDLIFPHHENEIAQSEAMTGEKPFVKYWLHTGFLKINGEKMAKSLGNYITVREALKKYSAEDIRLFVLSTHYRSEIDFTEDLEKARKVFEQRDIEHN